MNWRHHGTTVVLVALAVILTGVVIWDKGRVSTGEADKRTENIIGAWRPDDVTKIEIEVGGRAMRIERERDEDQQLVWALFEGDKRLDGDALEMSEVASVMELAMFYRKVEDIDEATLGFAEPRARYVVHMGKLTYTVRVGGEAAQPKGGAYVDVDGGARGRVIYVVTKVTAEEFLIDLNKLLNKTLSPISSNAVAQYEISGPAGKYTLERGGWGGWTTGAFKLKAEGIEEVRADRNAMDRLIGGIGHIEATRFVPITKKDPPDAITIKMTPREEGALKAHLVVAPKSAAGCGDSEAYAIRRTPDPIAACIDKKVMDELLISAKELRDRRVVGTERAAITELKLEGMGTVVDIARKADGWHMRKPSEGPAQKEPTDQLVLSLVKAMGDRVEHPDLEALGLAKPRGTVRIIGLPERSVDGAAKEREEKIDVGDEVDGKVYVRRRDDGAVIALPVDVGGLFLPQPTLLRSSVIFTEQRKYIREIDVDCGGRRQKITRGLDANFAWVIPKDLETAVDPGLANTLMDRVRELTALRWASETVLEKHRLEKPWCSILLEIDEPDPADATGKIRKKRSLILHLGAETQGGYFGRVGNEDAVFVAPRAVASAANVWMLERLALRLGTRGVDTITVTSGEKSFVARREGEAWKGDGGADATAMKVGDAFEKLIAEIVETRGAAREGDGFDAPTLKVVVTFKDKPDEKLTFLVGDGTRFRNAPVFRIRRSDENLTFLVADTKVRPLFDAL